MALPLHFSGDTPEDQFYTDFGNLNKFEDEAFSQLVTLVFNFLTDPKESSLLLSQLEDFASHYSFGVNALKNLLKSVLIFFKAAIRKNLSPQHVKEDLTQLGLTEQKASWVAGQWRTHLASVTKAAAGQSLTINQLLDMEWRFGVTAGGSDMRKSGNTYLQLKLVLDKGSKSEDVFMELSLPQFYSFLHEMEKAKASLEYLS